MKKEKRLIYIIFIMLIVIISAFILINKNKKELFIYSYRNSAWGYRNYGYIIYTDGTIKEYDYADESRELKSAKISQEELNSLKELANEVDDEYEKDNSMVIYDAGLTTEEIYNSKTKRWIVLSKWGDAMGSNNSEEAKKILKIVHELYNKYLDE